MRAIDQFADPGLTAGVCAHPGPLDERRIVAHVLGVPTGKVSHPVTFCIPMKTTNFNLHGRSHPARCDS